MGLHLGEFSDVYQRMVCHLSQSLPHALSDGAIALPGESPKITPTPFLNRLSKVLRDNHFVN